MEPHPESVQELLMAIAALLKIRSDTAGVINQGHSAATPKPDFSCLICIVYDTRQI